MTVVNVHTRKLAAPPARAGALIDTLASSGDRLWPRGAWPAMRFDRPLGVGAAGGHGPIRYTVVAYQPGQSVTFRFTAPRGFDGTHAFQVVPDGDGCTLRHVLAMDTHGRARVTWPLVFRWLHDALIEDALATAQIALGEPPMVVPWSRAVRALRWLLSPGRTRPQMQAHARRDRPHEPLRARARRDRRRDPAARICHATRRRVARTKPR